MHLSVLQPSDCARRAPARPVAHRAGATRPPARRAAAPHAPAAAIDPLELAQHRRHLVGFAMRRLRDAAHAEDLVQETLLAALQGAGRFQGDAAVRTWLTGILKHKILDHFRRARRESPLAEPDDVPATEDIDAPAARQGEPAVPMPPGWGDPEAAFAQERFFEVLERGIARLPGNAARVFQMREVLGMSTDEICRTLGISASNCAVLLHRARASLRDYLQSEWFGGADTAPRRPTGPPAADGPASARTGGPSPAAP